jgi:hypothetical protein
VCGRLEEDDVWGCSFDLLSEARARDPLAVGVSHRSSLLLGTTSLLVNNYY